MHVIHLIKKLIKGRGRSFSCALLIYMFITSFFIIVGAVIHFNYKIFFWKRTENKIDMLLVPQKATKKDDSSVPKSS